MIQFPVILIGAVVGTVVGLTSIGAGSVLTSVLVLFLGVPPSVAIGVSLLNASGMKLFGGVAYASRQDVHWPTVWRLATGSIPGAVLGTAFLHSLPSEIRESVLGRILGAVLVLAGITTLVRLLLRRSSTTRPMPSWSATAALGFVIGLLVSTTSVGSGSVLLCALTLFVPLRPQTLVGTDLAHAFLLAVAATVGRLITGQIDVPLTLTVLAGAIPGVLLGARLSIGLPERALRLGLATLLVGVGVHLAIFNVPEARAAVVRDAVPPHPTLSPCGGKGCNGNGHGRVTREEPLYESQPPTRLVGQASVCPAPSAKKESPE